MLIFITKLIERLDTILQAPDITESCIFCCNNFSTHRVRSDGEIETAKATRHRHTVHTCAHHRLQISFCSRSITNAVAFMVRTFKVYSLSIIGNGSSCYVANYVEHAIVTIHRIGIVQRCVIKFIFVCKVAFFQLNDALHKRMVQLELQFLMIAITICHISYLLFSL